MKQKLLFRNFIKSKNATPITLSFHETKLLAETGLARVDLPTRFYSATDLKAIYHNTGSVAPASDAVGGVVYMAVLTELMIRTWTCSLFQQQQGEDG
jgi:hypothetical protein